MVLWLHNDPDQKSFRSATSSGSVWGSGTDGSDWVQIEADPDGSNVGINAPGPTYPTESFNLYEAGWSFGAMDGQTVIDAEAGGIHVPREYSTGESQWH